MTSALVTVFSTNLAFSGDTVYIGGSGKISVQVDLEALDGSMHPKSDQYPVEFTNSFNAFETFEAIQLNAPTGDQNWNSEKRNNQLKLSEANSSMPKQKPKTREDLTIGTEIPAQKPGIQAKANNLIPDTPDPAINSEQKKVAKYSSPESPRPLNKNTEELVAAELAIGGSWKIPFNSEEANLPNSSLKTLTSIATALNQNDKFRLQLKAYAADHRGSASHARRLSLTRALAVRSFLIEKGVRSTRIDVRALGNKSENGKNDRVDVYLVKR